MGPLEEAVVDNTDLPMKQYRFTFEEFEAKEQTWKPSGPAAGAWLKTKSIVAHSAGPHESLETVRKRFEKMSKP